MFRLLTSTSTGGLFKRQLPVFLATWFVLDAALHLLTGRRSPQRFPHGSRIP